ncbi:condensation domain-containing protein [Parapedobacter tibetensis]|uniref:condensation domain-containing protein n=1 Tax=Parapedobacter tibetensis TaxID=2972951 RepID=UPI00214D6B88|nr:condensation domain-containing protein [Parapedobacter tibetensis]
MIKERDLLFLERVLYGDGTAAFNGVFALRIKGQVDEGRLRQALQKVQAKHPILKAYVVNSAKGLPAFRVAEQGPEIPLIVGKRKGDTTWKDAVKKAWGTIFDIRIGPLAQLEMLLDTDGADLIFAFHHCICDGGGGVVLMSELLKLLDNPNHSMGPAQGLPGLEAIIPSKVQGSSKQRRRTRLLARLLRVALSTSVAFVSTKNKPKISRVDDYLIHWKCSQAFSAKLFSACSAKGVTVNTVLSLAFLLAFKQVRGRQAHGRLTCPVDIRRFVPGIDKDSLFSFGLVLKFQLTKNGTKDFWQQAKALQTQSDKQVNGMKPYDFLMVMENLHGALDNMLKVLTYGKVSNDLMFSNIGKLQIPQTYTDFEVDTIFSPTVIGPFANPTTVITSTYKGQLDFSFVCNEGFIQRSDAESIRNEAIANLELAVATA